MVIGRQPFIFGLPLELRTAIYTLVIKDSMPLPRLSHNHQDDKNRNKLALLLANRQINAETRLLPFQLNTFEFAKWNGAGLDCCLSFLCTLQDWQIHSIRHINLRLMVHSLACKIAESTLLDLCNKLGSQSEQDTGLWTLQLAIEGVVVGCGVDLFDADATWVTKGLLKLQSLRSLRIIGDVHGIGGTRAKVFNEELQKMLPSVSVVVELVERSKMSIAQLSGY